MFPFPHAHSDFLGRQDDTRAGDEGAQRTVRLRGTPDARRIIHRVISRTLNSEEGVCVPSVEEWLGGTQFFNCTPAWFNFNPSLE